MTPPTLDAPVVKCAWCGAHMGGNPLSTRVSHGICQPCMDKIKAESRLANVLALGFQDHQGRIVVTDVLANNVPEMTSDQKARLSWKLSQFFSQTNQTEKEP